MHQIRFNDHKIFMPSFLFEKVKIWGNKTEFYLQWCQITQYNFYSYKRIYLPHEALICAKEKKTHEQGNYDILVTILWLD